MPLGLQTLYRIASYAVDPVTFGPWLAVVLAPLSAWLVFLIVRQHTDWWPAAWMGAALFMLPVNSLRFSGGHARAFSQPVVLLTVYLLLRRRYWMAAAIPAVGSLFYPPSAVSALAIMAASCLTLRGRRPSLERARTLPALACVAVSGIGLLLPRLIGHEQALITRSQAHALPDFGPGGQMHFFSNRLLTILKGTYSGLDMGPSLAILLFTPVVLLLLRPRNIVLLRRELLWMLVTSVLLYALALAVLFRLYLPNRYTYPLLPFSCVAIAVAWRPTFESLGHRLRPALAWLLIPLGLAIKSPPPTSPCGWCRWGPSCPAPGCASSCIRVNGRLRLFRSWSLWWPARWCGGAARRRPGWSRWRPCWPEPCSWPRWRSPGAVSASPRTAVTIAGCCSTLAPCPRTPSSRAIRP